MKTGREGGGNREGRRVRWEQGEKRVRWKQGGKEVGAVIRKLWELGGNARSRMLRPSCSAAVTSHTK